jgi:GNAT superfamily N-acetyltransferase
MERIILRLIDGQIFSETYSECFKKYDAILELYIDPVDGEAIITSVFTHPRFRNRGYATLLVRTAIILAEERDCKWVTLTDSSDTGQLYVKLGFEYINYPQPEMIKYIR